MVVSKEKSLVVVESPAKAKTIEKFLGSDYKVVASFGHIRDLPSSAVDVAGLPAREEDDRILSVDRALERFAAEQPNQARLVEMRYFGGLKVDEVAAALRLSPRTVARDWVVAKAWLARELREEHGIDD